MDGYIKLYRRIRKSEMWRSLKAVQRDVTITILLMASYREKRWEWNGKTYEVKPGQFVTSLDTLENECAHDVTIQNIKTTLAKLKKWGFLTWEPLPNRRGRIITITNWEKYQATEEEQREPEPTPEPRKGPKPKKKDGKEPPEKKHSNPYDTEFESLWQEYPNKKGKAQALKAYKKHRKAGVSVEDFRAALDRYKREIRQKDTPKEYIKHGKTFFISGFEDYMGDDAGDGDVIQVEPQRLEMPGIDFLQQQLEKAMENL